MTEMGLLSSRLSAVKKDGRKQSDSVEYHPIASSNLASFNLLTREFSKVGLCVGLKIRRTRFESLNSRSLVSMNTPLYPNRRRVSGLSEDGKADRVVGGKGMGKSEISPKEYLSRWISAKSCSS